ncbi:MAG: hypothetical protein ACK4ND_04395 [Cytophagaceae bacterium]
MRFHWYIIFGIVFSFTMSCGDPSRPAAREAADLERGRIMDFPREGADTTINKTAGGGTGVRIFEADSVISRNKEEEGERLKN